MAAMARRCISSSHKICKASADILGVNEEGLLQNKLMSSSGISSVKPFVWSFTSTPGKFLRAITEDCSGISEMGAASGLPFSLKITDGRFPYAMSIGSKRLFSADVSHMPAIADPDVKNAFEDLMAASWDELPDAVVNNAKVALSKGTNDKAGQEVLANVFHAAEAVEHFCGVLVSLRMELDDSTGLSGDKVGRISDELQAALRAAYNRYMTYLEAFGPDETYLRKKVEMELGTKMIHIKMRCSGLGAEWGKVTVLGTSGLSGSYVEHRA